MAKTRTEKTRWGDIVYVDVGDGFESVRYPTEHPHVVADEAVEMAGNQIDCLSHHDRYEIISRVVDLDHLPREQRVRETAVQVVAMAIMGKWADCLYPNSESDKDAEAIPADQMAEYAALRLEAESLVKLWRKNERLNKKDRKKRRGE